MRWSGGGNGGRVGRGERKEGVKENFGGKEIWVTEGP